MIFRVDLIVLHRCNQVVELIGVGFSREKCCSVIPRKRLLNHHRIVEKVQHKGVVLLRMAAIQAGERLHSLDVIEHLVHIHGVQQRLVKARLEHICYDENAIRVRLKH